MTARSTVEYGEKAAIGLSVIVAVLALVYALPFISLSGIAMSIGTSLGIIQVGGMIVSMLQSAAVTPITYADVVTLVALVVLSAKLAWNAPRYISSLTVQASYVIGSIVVDEYERYKKSRTEEWGEPRS